MIFHFLEYDFLYSNFSSRNTKWTNCGQTLNFYRFEWGSNAETLRKIRILLNSNPS